ncbi:MAG: DUF3611 family protein [Hydrococcus sp. Prado102]|jgi:hypothetical protein|nr:DUF3611 family protein [Hydrococcus sp. Prado102]
MSENYDITPRTIPSNVQRASSILKRIGRIGFWLQIVLGVISAVLLLIASASLFGSGRQRTQGIEIGILCALIGVILLGAGIYFSWRYTQIARLMQVSDSGSRPRKAETLQVIRYGLVVNLVGMLFAILGAEALAGIVLVKSLNVPQGVFNQDFSKFVNSVDLLIVQANTNTIAAHFAGIVSTLWLLERITK